MGKRLEVPKDLERLIEKRDSEKDRRAKAARPKTSERRQKRRRKNDS